jgi:hypothetical protein
MVVSVKPWELEHLRRSVVMLPPGHSAGAVTKTQAEELLADRSHGDLARYQPPSMSFGASSLCLGLTWAAENTTIDSSHYHGWRRVKGLPVGQSEDTERSGVPQRALDAPVIVRQTIMVFASRLAGWLGSALFASRDGGRLLADDL